MAHGVVAASGVAYPHIEPSIGKQVNDRLVMGVLNEVLCASLDSMLHESHWSSFFISFVDSIWYSEDIQNISIFGMNCVDLTGVAISSGHLSEVAKTIWVNVTIIRKSEM